MKEHGDPNKRGADHGEAYGASIKDTIHRRTLRRKLTHKATTHVKRDASGEVKATWQQKALKMSRIMQVWRDMTVMNTVVHDEASHDYLQRKHYKLATTGFATVGHAAAAAGEKGRPPASVLAKIEEARKHA